MRYTGHTLHKISSKCGIFAEADANTLLKAGVTVDEIIASLFEAVVYQNLATLTRGNTPLPEVLLLGGPNLFFKGLQEAWRLHLTHIWKERKVQMLATRIPQTHHRAGGCAVLRGAGLRGNWAGRAPTVGCTWARRSSNGGSKKANTKRKRSRAAADSARANRTDAFKGISIAPVFEDGRNAHGRTSDCEAARQCCQVRRQRKAGSRVVVGCDFGSTTAKAVCLSPEKEIAFLLLRAEQGKSD